MPTIIPLDIDCIHYFQIGVDPRQIHGKKFAES